MRGFIGKTIRLLAAAFLALTLLFTVSAVFADEDPTVASGYTETAAESPTENMQAVSGEAEKTAELSFREKYGKPLSIISITILLLLVLMQLIVERIESHRKTGSISAEAARLSDSLKVAETAGDIMAEYISRQNDITNNTNYTNDTFESGYVAADEVFELSRTMDKLLKPYKTVFKNAGVSFTVSSELENNRLMGDKSVLTDVLSCLLCGALYSLKNHDDVSDNKSFDKGDKGDNGVNNGVNSGLNNDEAYEAYNIELVVTEKDPNKTRTTVRLTLRQDFGSSDSLWIRIAKSLPGIADSGIKIRSRKSGKNCVTAVTMPLYIAPEDSQSAFVRKDEKTFDFSGMTALIAENNELNLAILSELLKDVGFDTICVRNGQQAVYAFNKPRPEKIDIIILDTDMPIMNGYDASNTIRKCKHANYATVPIIGIVPDARSKRPSELDKIKKSSLTDTVSKALNTDELYYTIEKTIEKTIKSV